MEVSLRGIHKVKMRLASGQTTTYYYAWRGGPRILSAPGTNAFIAEFMRLTRSNEKNVETGTASDLIASYKKSSWFTKLKRETQRVYDLKLDLIDGFYGSMRLEALQARGARRDILAWHESMSAAPRSADLTLAVFQRVIAYAIDQELITRNPLVKFEKLHHASRRDIIWPAETIELMLSKGKPYIADVVQFGLWTMQRQKDILTATTMAYDGTRLRIKQGKTGETVWITPPAEILPIIEQAKQEGRQRILVNSLGQNWTSSGFQTAFRREIKRLGITGLTFHDLRGTGITFAYASGVSIEDIALISGHTEASANKIIRKNYLASGAVMEGIRKGIA